MALSGRRIFLYSSRGTGAVLSRPAQVVILALILALLASAGLAGAQEAPKTPGGPGFDADKHFTIVKIEPDPLQEEVKVFFSQPLLLDSLRSNLRLLPRVKIDWQRTTMTPEGS